MFSQSAVEGLYHSQLIPSYIQGDYNTLEKLYGT